MDEVRHLVAGAVGKKRGDASSVTYESQRALITLASFLAEVDSGSLLQVPSRCAGSGPRVISAKTKTVTAAGLKRLCIHSPHHHLQED